MYANYKDIRDLTSEPPDWFDENGVPRYGRFTPNRAANIYAQEVVLAEIRCQACLNRFNVAFSELNAHDDWHWVNDTSVGSVVPRISELIESRSLHYGDPPNIQCCAAGPTMNSIPIRVVEYWFRRDTASVPTTSAATADAGSAWPFIRDPVFEKDIQQDWSLGVWPP